MSPKFNNFYVSCILTKFHQFLFNFCTDVHTDGEMEPVPALHSITDTEK